MSKMRDTVGQMSATRWVMRVRNEDSAFVYFVMEAQEGVMSYRTLDYRAGDRFRDIEVLVPSAFNSDAERVLQSLPEVLTLEPASQPYII